MTTNVMLCVAAAVAAPAKTAPAKTAPASARAVRWELKFTEDFNGTKLN